MSKYKFVIISILIISMGILYNGCKKKDKDEDKTQNDVKEKLNTNLNALHDAAVIYNDELQQSGDSIEAFIAMKDWLTENAEVSGGWYHNVEFLEIEFANGLKSSINVIPVSESGEHLSRGGGGANSLETFHFKKINSQDLKNKKVLIMIPYPEVFSYSNSTIQELADKIQASDTEMEVDLDIGADVELKDLERFGDYGFIILDVHGTKYGFVLSYIEKEFEATDLWFPEDLINEVINVQNIPSEKIADGEIEISLQINNYKNGDVKFHFSVLITEEYIRNLNVDMSDAVVFGNHCYSGHTADGPTVNNLPQAWRSKGVSTYYGYALDNGKSIPVDNKFSKAMEQLLINGLVVDNDTTGSANLNPDGTTPYYDSQKGYELDRSVLLTPVKKNPPHPTRYLFFVQFFDKDYKYERCGEDLIDERDHHVYQTTCIDGKKWMAENLNYTEAGVWYDNDPANGETFGRLYSIEEATGGEGSSPGNHIRGICPQGWHVPSSDEIGALFDAVGGIEVAGDALKADTIWAGSFEDKYGFSILPSGDWQDLNGNISFTGLGTRGWYWTSTVDTSYNKNTYIIYAFDNQQRVQYFGVDNQNQIYKLACRCVKD